MQKFRSEQKKIVNKVMLGSKGILPPTDTHELLHDDTTLVFYQLSCIFISTKNKLPHKTAAYFIIWRKYGFCQSVSLVKYSPVIQKKQAQNSSKHIDYRFAFLYFHTLCSRITKYKRKYLPTAVSNQSSQCIHQ